MSQRQEEAVKVLLDDPDVYSVSSFIGVDAANPTLNTGRMQIALKPHSQRDQNAAEIMRRLQDSLASQSGMQFYLQPVQDLTVEDRVSRTQYQLTLETPYADLLAEWVPRLVERMRQIPELVDVADDLQNEGLHTYLEIDREAASRLGVTATAITGRASRMIEIMRGPRSLCAAARWPTAAPRAPPWSSPT